MKRIIQSVIDKVLSRSSIDRLKTDDLRRKNIVLRNEERKLYTEIEGTEKAKVQLFDQARGKEVSDRQRMQAARKIEGLDVRLKELDCRLTRNTKEQRIVEGLLRIKEQKPTEPSGSILFDVDPSELKDWIEKQLLDQQMADEKALQILGLLDQDMYVDTLPSVSEAQQSIYEQICKAAESQHEVSVPETSELDSLGGEKNTEVSELPGSDLEPAWDLTHSTSGRRG